MKNFADYLWAAILSAAILLTVFVIVAGVADFNDMAKPCKVKIYTDGKLVKQYTSTGRLDCYQEASCKFTDATTGNKIYVSSKDTIVSEYLNGK